MSDKDRIALLEARIAALEARLAAIEAPRTVWREQSQHGGPKYFVGHGGIPIARTSGYS